MKARVSRLSVDNFLVSQCRKFLEGNPAVLCFRNFPVANNLMNKRGGESIKIYRRKFCLTMSKKIVGESFSVS